MLYTTAGEHGLIWSLWQETPRETQDLPPGFWTWGCEGSKADYIVNAKEILAACERVEVVSGVVVTASWHSDRLCYAGCLKEGSLLHFMQPTL